MLLSLACLKLCISDGEDIVTGSDLDKNRTRSAKFAEFGVGICFVRLTKRPFGPARVKASVEAGHKVACRNLIADCHRAKRQKRAVRHSANANARHIKEAEIGKRGKRADEKENLKRGHTAAELFESTVDFYSVILCRVARLCRASSTVPEEKLRRENADTLSEKSRYKI